MNPFEPYTLKNRVTLKNRLVLAPMTTYSGNEDLTVSEEEKHYYALRAKHLGMVITAATSINDSAQAFERQITLKDDAFIPSMRSLANIIQAEGAKAVVQLHHGGRMNQPSLYEDKSKIVSASAVPAPRPNMPTPRALDIDEITKTIDDFAQATRRAIEAGYDGVELHGANTYLLQQFFSPHSNQRDDRYGGSTKNRMRFIEELIDKVYEVINRYADNPFILGYRFSPEELEAPGITLEDTVELVRMLKDKPLDYLHVSLQTFDQTSLRNKDDTEPIVNKLAKVIDGKVPFMGVGGLKNANDLTRALSYHYDLLALGVALLADPDWPKKIQQNLSPSKIFDAKTLPTHLYARLKKNAHYFKSTGYRFDG